MKITHLARGKKTPRINVFVDDKFAFSVEEITLVKFGLHKGREISSKEIDRIRTKDIVEKFTFKVIGLLGRRPRSVREVRDYLNRKLFDKRYGVSKDEANLLAEEIISGLREKNYLNDYDFAVWWVKAREEFRPRGKGVLKKELFEKGIEKEIIDEILTELVDDRKQIETAVKIAMLKYERLKRKEENKLKIKSRLSSYLYSRGYSWDIILEAFKQLNIK